MRQEAEKYQYKKEAKMGLRINTNVAALNAEKNLMLTNNRLSNSLTKLSTGLRINKAADDPAGMTIADGLRFQSNNLLKAIDNGNHAISAIQLADQGLQKTVDLINQISARAVTASNDTEDATSRAALQADINKFLIEINDISNTTSYKGTKLLDGSFIDKFFQVGAYADQTISLSVNKTDSTSIGKIATVTGGASAYTSSLTGASVATSDLQFSGSRNFIGKGLLTINGVDVEGAIDQYASTSQLDAKNMTAAINQSTTATGVTATATNTVTASAALTAGNISDGALKINGVNIGATDSAHLVDAINAKSADTGVTAAIDSSGELQLTATDGRNIAIANATGSGVSGITHIADTATTVVVGSVGVASTREQLLINGVKVSLASGGSLGDMTAGIRTALANAGITDITVASNGTIASIVLTINDGNDLNVHGASITSSLGSRLVNDSNHGTITLTADKTIAVGGTKTKIGGLSKGNTAVSGSLSGVNVTTQAGAETTITRAGAALTAIDIIRGNLGAAQNQIQATVENIQTTQLNVKAAESNIRDVNFAEETATFSKLQILAQSGTFALAQANTISQNILRLMR